MTTDPQTTTVAIFETSHFTFLATGDDALTAMQKGWEAHCAATGGQVDAYNPTTDANVYEVPNGGCIRSDGLLLHAPAAVTHTEEIACPGCGLAGYLFGTCSVTEARSALTATGEPVGVTDYDGTHVPTGLTCDMCGYRIRSGVPIHELLATLPRRLTGLTAFSDAPYHRVWVNAAATYIEQGDENEAVISHADAHGGSTDGFDLTDPLDQDVLATYAVFGYKLDAMLETYPPQDPGSFDRPIPDPTEPWLLIESNQRGTGYYLSCHATPDKARAYHADQEYADWTIEQLIHLGTDETD